MMTFAKKRNSSEVFYDLIEDYDAIEASFAQQYGIRLRLENEMLWDEFCTLLSGINGDTPLGYLVRIRGEKDPKARQRFTKEEKKIYSDWRKRESVKVRMTMNDTDRVLRDFAAMFR